MIFRKPLSCLLLLSLGLSLRAEDKRTAEAVQKFKESLKTVDRLVVEQYEMGGSMQRHDERILLDIKDSKTIATLGETIEIKEFREMCPCMGNVVIHFYQGNEEKFPLTLDHYYKLRADGPYKKFGQQSPWADDAILTEVSAAKFRVWFAEHGYDGFVKGYAYAIKAGEEAKREWQLFLELFPEPVRDSFPSESEFVAAEFARSDDFREEKYRDLIKVLQERGMAVPPDPEIYVAEQRELRIKREQWIARYADRTKLILDCWRGIGKYDPKGINPGNPVPQFLSFLVDATTPEEIGVAFEHIPADEDAVWVGAYLYYSGLKKLSEERKIRVLNTDRLARLIRRVMPRLEGYQQLWSIDELVARPSVATNQLLLEIGESGPMVLSKAEEEDDGLLGLRLPNAVHALLALAKNQVAGCRTIVSRRMTATTETEIRLALEVALAQFDGPALIQPAHLQSKSSDVAELAWQTISKDPKAKIPLETLAVLAAKSPSYNVQDMAKKKLQGLGLRVMTDQERAAVILNEPRFKNAESLADIEALITEYGQSFAPRKPDDVERHVLAVLNHRKGLLLLGVGDFEQAAPLLKGGNADRNMYPDQVLAWQTLGRFRDASSSLHGMLEGKEGDALKRYLVRSAYLAFAQGDFAMADENFAFALTIGSLFSNEGPVELIHYLSQLLAGRKAAIPTGDWELIGTSEKEAAEMWPDSGILFLQGRLTEPEVFAQIDKQDWEKEKNLCEAHFFFSVLNRVKGDQAVEKQHLQAALETRQYTTQCFSLATLRMKQLTGASVPVR